jgi:hypothetical protein
MRANGSVEESHIGAVRFAAESCCLMLHISQLTKFHLLLSIDSRCICNSCILSLHKVQTPFNVVIISAEVY